MDAHIRTIMPDDEPFLWTALYHALHVPPGGDAYPREIVHEPDLARYAEAWMRRDGDFGVLAEAEGEPVGAAWLRRWSNADQGFGFVDEATPELSMSVLPGYRGRGIGTALLTRVLSDAEGSVDAISLSVSLTNPAYRLYRRFGFEPIGEASGESVTMVARFTGEGAAERQT